MFHLVRIWLTLLLKLKPKPHWIWCLWISYTKMWCLISFTIETCHKIYISNDKSETERKNGSLTAIISLRKLYSARQYHSQIHIPVAIELTNKTAWRALNMYKVPTVFFFLHFSEGRKPDAGMLRESWLLPMLQYPLLANHSVCMVTPPILCRYTYKPLFDRGSGSLPKCVLTLKVWVKSGFP